MIVPDRITHLFSERFRQAASSEPTKDCPGLRLVMECSHLLLLSREFLGGPLEDGDLPISFRRNGTITLAGKLFSSGYDEHFVLAKMVKKASSIVMLYEFDGMHLMLTMKCEYGEPELKASWVKLVVKSDGRVPAIEFSPESAPRMEYSSR